jgi:Nucleotidyl transferase AbiEii toxin, Type IV TA system
MELDPLKQQLTMLARELQNHDIRLIVGGGYGLLLRTEHILKTEPVTRFYELPPARSTEDIDLFLGVEIITSLEKMKKIRDTLENIGFTPEAKYFQFKIQIDPERPERVIKVDLLAAPPATEEQIQLVRIRRPRIRPKGAKNIHAYLTDEAVTLDEELFAIDITPNGSPLFVYLPHPFTYLVLKLFALRDRIDDDTRAPYHAFDIYRIIGMMTEDEWNQSVGLSKKYENDPKIREAEEIVITLFANEDAPGILRIYRHAGRNAVSTETISKLIVDLKDLFVRD